jgi:hypothetical protein
LGSKQRACRVAGLTLNLNSFSPCAYKRNCYCSDMKTENEQIKTKGITNTVETAQNLYKQGNREWVETDPQTFEYFLNVLPPIYGRGCFACSEEWMHNHQGEGVYLWFRNFSGKYEARYATVAEMK